jgi:hypothetical protein
VSWQFYGIGARTDTGESGMDSVYTPGSPPVDAMEFAGVVETRRALELGVRYWPASGVDIAASAGFHVGPQRGARRGARRSASPSAR